MYLAVGQMIVLIISLVAVLVVLILIRRGLNRINNQLGRVMEMLPECWDWDKESVDRDKDRGKKENGLCKENIYMGRDMP